MSVRRLKEKGSKNPGPWIVDINMEMPNGQRYRMRKVSPIQTRRGALEYERQLRESLLNQEHADLSSGPLTFSEFSEVFMSDHVSASNKASELVAKRSILRLHLIPAFGRTNVSAPSSTASA